MFGKLTLVNLILTGIAGFLSYEVHQTWVAPPVKPGIEMNEERKDLSSESPSEEFSDSELSRNKKILSSRPRPMPSMKEYQVIGQKNLFRPDRKEWVPPPSTTDEKSPLIPSTNFTLYGVVTMPDGSKMALLSESALPSSRARRASFRNRRKRQPRKKRQVRSKTRLQPSPTQKVRVNDMIGGYRVAEILHDKVILSGKGQKTEVLLRDPENPKNRPRAPAVVKKPASPPPKTRSQKMKTPPAVKAKTSPTAKKKQVIQTPFGPRVIYR